MKLFTPLSHLLIATILILIFAGCSKPKPGVYKNEQIEESIRNSMHTLNNDLLKALKKNDKYSVESVISHDLIESNFINTNGYAASALLKQADFELLDEYYVVNKFTDKDTIPNEGKGVNKHTLVYTPDAREMYIALYASKAGANRNMITAVFAKFDYGWKLSHMTTGAYTINGKTCPELYNLAQTKYKNDQLADAYLTMQNALLCQQPSLMWQYDNMQAINQVYYELGNLANDKYNFPYVIGKVATRPAIVNIYYKTTNDGNFPLVGYLTQVDIKNKKALIAENNAVKGAIEGIMPGLNSNNKKVYYLIYKPKAGGGKEVTSIEFEDNH